MGVQPEQGWPTVHTGTEKDENVLAMVNKNSCNVEDRIERFGETYCLCMRKTKAVFSSETYLPDNTASCPQMRWLWLHTALRTSNLVWFSTKLPRIPILLRNRTWNALNFTVIFYTPSNKCTNKIRFLTALSLLQVSAPGGAIFSVLEQRITSPRR